jgi:ribosomal protein S18 acetylase RimI-like enzyme
MIQATYNDKTLVVDILSKAFDSNKSVNYVIKQDKKKSSRIKMLMEYSFEMCWHFGEIYLSNDKNGVVLILLPEKKKTTIKSILWDIKLIIGSIGITRIPKVLKRESKIKKFYPEKLMYLWYIGVLPGYQGKGIGGSLLKEMIRNSDEKKTPIYLETSMSENVPFYNKYDFELYKELDAGHQLYMFKKVCK